MRAITSKAAGPFHNETFFAAYQRQYKSSATDWRSLEFETSVQSKMNTKTLLAIFSMTEILLLVILGTLSDKLAELIQLRPITILIVTLVLVTLLAGITFYKLRIVDSRKKTISLPKPKIRLTQQGVNKFIWWLGYSPFALMLSLAAFHLSEQLDTEWHALLPGIAVAGTLFAYPFFRDQAIEEGHKMLPLFVAWIFSVMYGGAGFLLVLTPDLLERYLPVFITVSVVTMAGLKYAYIFHLIETIFEPWYRKLPEN